MPFFRKKPVTIKAIVWDNRDETIATLKAMGCMCYAEDGQEWLRITTLEGTMTASLGDYVICGVRGEFYPCKPDIFAATYELVE